MQRHEFGYPLIDSTDLTNAWLRTTPTGNAAWPSTSHTSQSIYAPTPTCLLYKNASGTR